MADSQLSAASESAGLTNIERVRLALAMADAGYEWDIELEYVEALLKAYDDLRAAAQRPEVSTDQLEKIARTLAMADCREYIMATSDASELHHLSDGNWQEFLPHAKALAAKGLASQPSPTATVTDERAFDLARRISDHLTTEEAAIAIMEYATDAIEAERAFWHSSAGNGGARAALDKLADKVAAKINQLQYYRDNDCQLDHAKTIAEGRLQQANQILHWIAEAAVSHTSEPQALSESDYVAALIRDHITLHGVPKGVTIRIAGYMEAAQAIRAMQASLALPRPHPAPESP